MSPDFTTEQLVDLVESYQNGATVRALSKRFGCRTDTVTEVLDQAGVEIRTGRSKLTDAQKAHLVERYLLGEKTGALAKSFKIHPATVTQVLTDSGVKLQVGRPKQRPPGWEDRVLDKVRSGKSQSQVAREMGTSQSVVSRLVRKAGIEAAAASPMLGNKNNWQGGRHIDKKGYVHVLPSQDDLAYCTPMSTLYVLEHRLVMGRHLGRPLTKNETVHHRDGNRQNNKIENLQLRQGKHGAGVVFTCNSCGSHDVQAQDLA